MEYECVSLSFKKRMAMTLKKKCFLKKSFLQPGPYPLDDI